MSPIYYDDPEPLILEPNQHYSTPQNRPNSTPPTEPIQAQPNPNPPYPTHHTPPTHHTHPTYHPEGTMHLCLRPPKTTTTTTTQPTPPTPPTTQKVLCTFAFAPDYDHHHHHPTHHPEGTMHLCLRPPTTTTTTTQPTTQKVLCTFAFAPRPPPPPPPYHPTTHHHTTQPPTHPPIRYECVFYHRYICSIVKKYCQVAGTMFLPELAN